LPARRRHRLSGGSSRFWRFNRGTTRSYLFDPAAARIAELQKAGVNARLIAPTGIAHHEAGRFTEPLREAVPWLQEVWK
jgi:hypothetical protein